MHDLLPSLAQQTWEYYVTRRFPWVVEMTQVAASQAGNQETYLGFSAATEEYLILDGAERGLAGSEKTSSLFATEFKRDPSFFATLAEKERDIIRQSRESIDKLTKLEVASCSDEQLIVHLEQFFEDYLRSFIPAWVRPDAFLEEEISARLQKNLGVNSTEAERMLRILAAPSGEGLAYAEEPYELLTIARDHRLGKETTNAIAKHVEKYAWMKGPLSWHEEEYTQTDYEERLQNLIKENVEERLNTIIRARQETKQAREDLIRAHDLTGELLILADALRDFVCLRTATTEISDQLFFVGRRVLLKEVGQRLDLSQEDIVMLSTEEIIEALRSKSVQPLKTLIEERKHCFAIVWHQGQIQTCIGEQASVFIQELKKCSSFQGSFTESSDIRGKCGYPGRVTGVVRIVLSHAEAKELRSGEILVASMTLPEYVVAMEKAAAFVTNEGGITCHAAILAREMNKPCVIGTRTATQILRTGDLIEVDAEQGIVTRVRTGE